ncbi:ATP-binding cassette domain-containing protein [Rhodococcus sp. 14C212]|uniref:ATP-binding cassette domain-containing protein n=1 Tax=Rhodococcus sp. 14C212 TaxID=2711209 RepID=UPI0013EB41B0|nr:ATP-binding cassette domain-containing protein [Rhodococcus sp. 14C212]NGP06742.1 ATP-binding cassette domain-containing protein [Rhodococcus sp. 14C212]
MYSAEPSLRFIGVTKTFGPVVAVKGVSLEILASEIHGVVGENGAGKSTLVGMATAARPQTTGIVEVMGERLEGANPRQPQQLGLAAVRQDPAIFPDMSVAENLWLKAPKSIRPPRSEMYEWARRVLDTGIAPGLVSERALASDLSVEALYTAELAVALAQNPKVMLLDEPTEHLGADLVATLFERLRELREAGCAVLYISHRLRDVQGLADRISVMRDGRLVETFGSGELTIDEIVAHIAGRPVDRIFPPKSPKIDETLPPVLEVRQLAGSGFKAVDFTLAAGEVVGLAGIEGNGQREFLRGLACLVPTTGSYEIVGHSLRRRTRQAASEQRIEYVPRDRRAEGLFGSLSVRENLQLDTADGGKRGGLIRRSVEQRAAVDVVRRFGIRTPSPETVVSSLSGGNAQKTVLARALNRDPKVLLLDEPSQGVDVGAREEIYRMIRSSVDGGASVVIAGSDAAELEGLCDRVLVFARGAVVAELTGNNLTERNIVGAAVTADADHRDSEEEPRHKGGVSLTLSRSWLLLLFNVLLAAAVSLIDSSYLSELNFGFMLAAFTTLGLVAMAQQAMLLIGGIDLSVGALAGLTVVVASFLLTGVNLAANLLIFVGVLLAMIAVVAAINYFVGDTIGLTPFIGTLATYTVLQAVMITMRPAPGGVIDAGLTDIIGATVGPVPIILIVCIAIGFLLQWALSRTVWGASLRAVGGAPDVAATVGMKTKRLRLSAYLLASTLAGIGGIMLMTQVGTGVNTAGLNYTFSSMTAAIVGGAVLTGGRGSFLTALLGAALVQQAFSATTFAGLSDAVQYYFVGGLIIIAALINGGRGRFSDLVDRVGSALRLRSKGEHA